MGFNNGPSTAAEGGDGLAGTERMVYSIAGRSNSFCQNSVLLALALMTELQG